MLDHFIRRLAQAQLNPSPFPYFHLRHIFPEDLYEKMLEFFPEEGFCLLSEQESVRPGAYSERSSFSLDEEGLLSLPIGSQIFWTHVASLLKSKECVEAILNLFSLEKKALIPDLALVSDRAGYSIGPHTDHPQKVLTLLFYFPQNEDQQNLGTSVYRPINESFRCDGLKHHSLDAFEKVYTAPFLPNSVFGFLRSDNSFHGVEKVQTEALRNSMSYTIYDVHYD